jgi:hypothetical protein
MESAMLPADAVAMINDVSYRPEWKISARAATAYERMGNDDLVVVSFLIDTVNTDRECAREGFPERRTLNPENIVDVSPLNDAADVHAVLMAMILELELHETREFFRVKSDDFNAPYHPHRLSGDQAWSEYFG